MSYKAGDKLPEIIKDPIAKVQLVMYAGASGDFNPIHTDDEAAQARGLKGVIAHGMLSMGFLGQLAEAAFGAGST
ncbi:MAG: dehydratase, partial [Nitrospinaceae bacterium]|nr:dehydratase [Nitrospinaceae bacterium]